MRLFSLTLAALALGLPLANSANAQQASADETPLARTLRLCNAAGAGQAGQVPGPPTTTNPVTYISIRGGAMVSPRGAALVGLDAVFPSIAIGPEWVGRLDADVIIKANFAGTNTVVPVTFNQIYVGPTSGTTRFYAGAGLGVVLGEKSEFTGKLILGAKFTPRLGAEANLYITGDDTLLTLLGRFRL